MYYRWDQLSREEDYSWDPIKRFNPATVLYPSQARTCISNIICCGLFVFSEDDFFLIFRHFHLKHCGALSFIHVYFVFQTFPFGSLWCFVMLWIQFVFCFSDISIWIIAVLCHTCLKWLDLMDLSTWHTQLKPSVLYYWYDKFLSHRNIFTEYQMF